MGYGVEGGWAVLTIWRTCWVNFVFADICRVVTYENAVDGDLDLAGDWWVMDFGRDVRTDVFEGFTGFG